MTPILEGKLTAPGLAGWVRSSDTPDVQPLLREIAALQEERESLRKELAERPAAQLGGQKLADLDESIQLTVLYRDRNYVEHTAGKPTATWGEVFGWIAPELHEYPNDDCVNALVASSLHSRLGYIPSGSRDLNVDAHSWGTIRTQFEALGFVTYNYATSVSKTVHLYWLATELGKKMGVQLRAVYTAKR